MIIFKILFFFWCEDSVKYGMFIVSGNPYYYTTINIHLPNFPILIPETWGCTYMPTLFITFLLNSWRCVGLYTHSLIISIFFMLQIIWKDIWCWLHWITSKHSRNGSFVQILAFLLFFSLTTYARKQLEYILFQLLCLSQGWMASAFFVHSSKMLSA